MIRDALLSKWEYDLPAVLGEEPPVSYAELAQRSFTLQAALPNVNKRSAAAILLPDGSDFLSALFAVLQAGWTAFPLNIHLTSIELTSLLSCTPVCTVITSSAMGPLCEAAVKACSPAPDILYVDAKRSFPQQPPDIQKTDPGAPMLLLASSGTTGHPKIVRLSETNMAFNVSAYLRHMGYEKYRDPSPRYALGTPFSAIYGLLVIFSCVLRGFPMLPMSENFTLDALFKSAQELGISHYDGGTAAALLMERTLGRGIPYDITSLRYFGFGGSKVPDGTFRRLSAAYPNIRFWSGYGMTEASPLIAQPFRSLPEDKLDSVGLPLPGVKVCLETETGITDEPDQPGEIIVRGPNIMLGYYEDEHATKEILRNGWLHTGDIGYFDGDGYLYICGRKKNMLLVRGFNVYPEEVETCLLACPLVKDCMVYGKADVPGSECVCADIVPSASQIQFESIQKWCAGHLADYKCPRNIRFVETLDKTATGKNRRAQQEAAPAQKTFRNGGIR
ncbi:AMP-binding protein [Clostridium sp. MCC353]|uniref:class I adenylate-forming enzyme family protein n=1 Tax=Clostridium sp. MCC353 TaxID=2592646 RepID=UPI001C037AB3|nr:class I adenylate-forming enzyme family protein [Clostridium sp. MCC353]MBT9777952.1 AMP-binding protein [Clostridium sp. MCC353]